MSVPGDDVSGRRVEARGVDHHDVLAELADELHPLLLEPLDRGRAFCVHGAEPRSANAWNCWLLETGSVSQPMPAIEPTRPST